MCTPKSSYDDKVVKYLNAQLNNDLFIPNTKVDWQGFTVIKSKKISLSI